MIPGANPLVELELTFHMCTRSRNQPPVLQLFLLGSKHLSPVSRLTDPIYGFLFRGVGVQWLGNELSLKCLPSVMII